MASKKKYRVDGAQPVVVSGATHRPGEAFEAAPGEVEFLVEVGAVKAAPQDEKKD